MDSLKKEQQQTPAEEEEEEGRKRERARERERTGPLLVRRAAYFFNFNYVSTMKCLPE